MATKILQGRSMRQINPAFYYSVYSNIQFTFRLNQCNFASHKNRNHLYGYNRNPERDQAGNLKEHQQKDDAKNVRRLRGEKPAREMSPRLANKKRNVHTSVTKTPSNASKGITG